MKVRFWGVRGSIPTPGKTTVKYGGNTSCIEIRGDNDELIIIDAGSGIRPLGEFILEHDKHVRPLGIKIFLTHTHWDHIQGFPFFAPSYLEDTTIEFYGPVNFQDRLEDIVMGRLNYKYFPVKLSGIKAKMIYYEMQETTIKTGNFTISTMYMNHPVLDLGYRIEYNDKIVVTMYDTEPYRNVMAEGINIDDLDEFDKISFEEGEEEVKKQTAKHKKFPVNADLLIYDSQYTKQEYEGKKGWGHSYIDYAIDTANEANVKRLALFHHDPLRNDKQVDEFQIYAQNYVSSGNRDMQVFCARERLEVSF